MFKIKGQYKEWMKVLWIGKGSILWKLPCMFFLLALFQGKFKVLMGQLTMLYAFLVDQLWVGIVSQLKESGFAETSYDLFIQVYAKVSARVFYESGIDFIIYQLFSLLVVFLFIFIVDRMSTKDLGLSFGFNSVFLLLLGLLVAGVLIFMIAGSLALFGNLEFMGSTSGNKLDILNLNNILVFQAVLYGLVSLQEELFARSYLINNIKWMGKWGAILLPSFVFAFLHLGNIGMLHKKTYLQTVQEMLSFKLGMDSYLGILNIFLLAVLFSIYFVRFQDVWFLIGVHFAWNFFMGPVLGMTVSSVERLEGRSIFMTELKGPRYLTGGSFGPEGSLVTTSLLGLILVVVFFTYRYKIRNRMEKVPKTAL
jgi:uncharacterized protein